MKIAELKERLARYHLCPDKRLGQNFLCHPQILERIGQAVCGPKVVEIGPGPGALTQELLKVPDRQLILIEKDVRMQPLLQDLAPQAILHIQDALAWDWSAYAGWELASNLPYHVSVPLMMAYVRASTQMLLGPATVMLQREVADRVMAKPNTPAYGRLSVMMQTYADVRTIVHVPPSAFWPKPSVMSTVIQVRPHSRAHDIPFERLEHLVACAFAQRRKMIHHGLERPYPGLLQTCDINGRLRAEAVSLAQFGLLARTATSYRTCGPQNGTPRSALPPPNLEDFHVESYS